MSKWPIVAIAVGWALAAVVLWLSGAWYERTHRYDGCRLAYVGTQAFWACPAELPDRPTVDERDDQA